MGLGRREFFLFLLFFPKNLFFSLLSHTHNRALHLTKTTKRRASTLHMATGSRGDGEAAGAAAGAAGEEAAAPRARPRPVEKKKERTNAFFPRFSDFFV